MICHKGSVQVSKFQSRRCAVATLCVCVCVCVCACIQLLAATYFQQNASIDGSQVNGFLAVVIHPVNYLTESRVISQIVCAEAGSVPRVSVRLEGLSYNSSFFKKQEFKFQVCLPLTWECTEKNQVNWVEQFFILFLDQIKSQVFVLSFG